MLESEVTVMRKFLLFAVSLLPLIGMATLSSAASVQARETAAFSAPPNTIVIKTSERKLYYIQSDGRAIRYSVGVGRKDKQWAGESYIDGKYIRPAWSPPEEIRREQPNLLSVIPAGAPNNPMGAAAMTLAGGEYAIHGTNAPSSIGGFVSYGCIRMHNQDIVDLFDRVQVGTRVIVQN